MAQRLKALAALPEVLSSTPSNHMVAHNLVCKYTHRALIYIKYKVLKKEKNYSFPALYFSQFLPHLLSHPDLLPLGLSFKKSSLLRDNHKIRYNNNMEQN